MSAVEKPPFNRQLNFRGPNYMRFSIECFIIIIIIIVVVVVVVIFVRLALVTITN